MARVTRQHNPPARLRLRQRIDQSERSLRWPKMAMGPQEAIKHRGRRGGNENPRSTRKERDPEDGETEERAPPNG